MSFAGGGKVGSLSTVQMSGEEMLPGKVNYLIGKDPAKWRSELSTYAKVRYVGVYPGIDLVFYGNQRELEYDFVVAPGASASAVQIKFDGQRRLHIAANGDLILDGLSGSAVIHQPTVFQENQGKRQAIKSSFQLVARNTVGFALGKYDHSRPLVIDPVLAYSTYLGGSGPADYGNGIAVDSDGSAYIVGSTYSPDFPVTDHAFQPTFGKTQNQIVYIAKFNPSGTNLVYSTFLGGTGAGDDVGLAIALDTSKNVYITGTTASVDFPVTQGVFQSANAANADIATAFVSKLSADGGRLVYSTYLGGSNGFNSGFAVGGDAGHAITVDGNGNAYVAGYTNSSDFPVTSGAFQTQYGDSVREGGSNAFVTKLSSDAASLVFSTFLGGGNVTGQSVFLGYGDGANGIAVDNSGDVYVAGSASSQSFPVTSGSFQSISPGLCAAFVTKLNAQGTELLYSTYIGGDFNSFGTGLAIDAFGSAFVAFSTFSSNFPGDIYPGFLPHVGVVKLNVSGASLDYTAMLGAAAGSPRVAVDALGNAYVTGTSGNNIYFPTTPDSSEVHSGTVFLAKVAPTGAYEEYAAQFGGSGFQSASGNAIALDAAGGAYVVGNTSNTDFPTTPGAFQTLNKGSQWTAFVSKFALADKNTPHYVSNLRISSKYLPTADADIYSVTVSFNRVDGEPIPTGVVSIYRTIPRCRWPCREPRQLWATVALDASGNAILSNSHWYPATYNLDATYSGDDNHLSGATSLTQPSGTSFTVSYRGILSITMQRLIGRLYGAANPVLSYTVSGLNPGLPVTIAAETNATAISPVGVYPVTATVTGDNAASYIIQITPTTLKVKPVLLNILAPSQTITYGQVPILPTSFMLKGFVNGETASVVSGIPIVSSSVTSTTSAGYYEYQIGNGTLAATNYYFRPFAHPGVVHVAKAPLTVRADDLIMHVGGPLPALTYSFSKFVNQDNAGNSVTGAPVLRTSVTTHTRPGTFPIYISTGTLASHNYRITGMVGTMTVLP